MAEIKKDTELMSLNQRLREFNPRGNLSLHDAVAQVKSNLENVDKPLAFVPASRLLTKNDTQESKQMLNNVAAKNKNCARRISSLNRDSLKQQRMESYFKTAEFGCSEIDSEKSTEENTLTDYRESDGSSNISSSESCTRESLRNVPFVAKDVDSSDSAQEFDCEEYDAELLNSDNEIEIIQKVHNETVEDEIINDKTSLCDITLQKNGHVNSTTEKTEVEINIKQENDSGKYLEKQEMAANFSEVKTHGSYMTPDDGSDQSVNIQSHNCRVKEEKHENSNLFTVLKTNHKKETVTESCNKQTVKKRKRSQDLFGDSSDDEIFLDAGANDQSSNSNMLPLSKDDASQEPERDSTLTHKKTQTNKVDKSSPHLRNTNTNCQVKEVTLKPVNRSLRYSVQNISECPKDKQDVQSSSNGTTRVNRQAVADIVVKHLMPFYKEKRIASKDLFKFVARQLAHHLLEHYSAGKLVSTGTHVRELTDCIKTLLW
jgi:hypothetical protein